MNRALIGQVVRYAGLSLVSATISFGLPLLLHHGRSVDPRVAFGIALCLAFAMNFVLLRRLVFRTSGDARRDLVRYTVTSLAFRGAEYLMFLVLFERIGLPYSAALFITLATSLCIKFVVQKLYVFRRPSGVAR